MHFGQLWPLVIHDVDRQLSYVVFDKVGCSVSDISKVKKLVLVCGKALTAYTTGIQSLLCVTGTV